MSNRYYQGDIVRLAVVFSFAVEPDTYFQLTDIGNRTTTLIKLGQTVDGLTFVADGGNPNRCYVDVDTFNRVGSFQYFFYSRGVNKAGAKSAYTVI